MSQDQTDVGSEQKSVTLKTREEAEQMIRDCSEKVAQLFREKNWTWGFLKGEKRKRPPTKEEIEKAWFYILTSAEEEKGPYRWIESGRLGAHYSKEQGYTLFLNAKLVKSSEDFGDGALCKSGTD